MEICCSLKAIAGRICGFRKECTHASLVIAILSCKKDINHHSQSLRFSGSQVELILSCAGMFKTPHNLEESTICLNHRSQLGVGVKAPIRDVEN